MNVMVVGNSLFAEQVVDAGVELRRWDYLHVTALDREYLSAIENSEGVNTIVYVPESIDLQPAEGQGALDKAVREGKTAAQLAIVARTIGATLIVVSSHWVFSGHKPYTTLDHPNPAQTMGMGFVWCERMARNIHDNVLVVRVGHLFGVERPYSWPHKVLQAVRLHKMTKNINPIVHVTNRASVTPTYDRLAALMLAAHINVGAFNPGVVHMGPDNPTTWFGFCGLVGSPAKASTDGPGEAWTPQQQALVPSPGWSLGSHYKSAAKFLAEWESSG